MAALKEILSFQNYGHVLQLLEGCSADCAAPLLGGTDMKSVKKRKLEGAR